MKIKTNRLIIRDFDQFDVDNLFIMNSDKESAHMAGFKPHPNRKVSLYQLQSILVAKDYLAITLHDGTMIGDLNYYKDPIRRVPNAWQVGFLLRPEFRHQGYMIEALKAFLEYMILEFDVEIISCATMLNNFSSQKTIESVGFNYDGIIRKYKSLYNGEIIDCKIYSLTKAELERKIEEWQKN